MEEYFYLYGVTAKALKSVSPLLLVGGPATSQSAWVAEFIQYCHDHSIPYDVSILFKLVIYRLVCFYS
jgi:xylan 1,4-beta-xylosidase